MSCFIKDVFLISISNDGQNHSSEFELSSRVTVKDHDDISIIQYPFSELRNNFLLHTSVIPSALILPVPSSRYSILN